MRGSVVGLVVVLGALVVAGTARADRAFSPRFSANETGDIGLAANTLLTCPASDAKCAPAQQGGSASNNSFLMGFVDADSDGATFDSSRAALNLPAGAQVLFAGLYWGANTSAGDRGKAAPNPSARDRVLLAAPGEGYRPVRASTLDTGSARSQKDAYQGFADVTARVSAAGAGTYTVGDVQAGTGLDRYAGWSLVVAYRLEGAPARNLTVFDGFASINSGDAPREVPVSGFTTPKRGSVDSRVGLVAYEGDRGLGGDSLALDGKALSDAAKPANNFFNSVISANGAPVRAKQPDYENQLGYDASTVDAPGALSNGATGATLKLQTSGDTYIPGVLFLSTQVFAPDVTATKSVRDLNGGQTNPGDVLEYTVSGVNRGQDSATGFTVTDPVAANTTVVPGSLAAGGGSAVYDAAGHQVVFRLGTLAPGERFTVRFRVTVDPGTTGTIDNRARLDYLADTLAFPILGETNQVSVPVVAPDLVLQKLHSGTLAPGTTATYFFSVNNAGTAATSQTVTVTDPFPAGVTPTGASGPGWTCDPPGAGGIRCTRTDPLAPGASYPDITATATVSATATGSLANTATVALPGDLNPSNNQATNSGVAAAFTNLSLAKHVGPDVVTPGQRVTYRVTARNDGPFNSTGMTVTDPLPAGLTLVSATATQGTCTGAVVCDLGPVPVFQSAEITVVADVASGIDARNITNTATVAGNEPDASPDPTANTATATVAVRAVADVRPTEHQDGPATAGKPVSWTISVPNPGPGTVTNGAITDLIPGVVQNPTARVTAGGGPCTLRGHEATCRLSPIPPGATTRVTVGGTLAPRAGGARLINGFLFTAGSFSPRPVPGRQTPPAGAVTGPAADLGVAKLGTPDPIPNGGVETYRLRVTNHGPSTATGVRLTDRLPARVTLVALPKGCTEHRRGIVVCKLANLRVRSSASRDLRVRVPSGRGGRRLVNRADVRGALGDPNRANDTDRTTGRTGPQLVLRKTAGRRTVRASRSVGYTLTLRNAGPTIAHNVTLCDTPGRGLKLARSPGARRARGRACWTLTTLRNGQTIRRHLTARTTPSGHTSVVNRATARAIGSRAAASATVRVRHHRRPLRFTG